MKSKYAKNYTERGYLMKYEKPWIWRIVFLPGKD